MRNNKVASIIRYRGDKKRAVAWARRLPQLLTEEEVLRIFALTTERYLIWSIETGLIIW